MERASKGKHMGKETTTKKITDGAIAGALARAKAGGAKEATVNRRKTAEEKDLEKASALAAREERKRERAAARAAKPPKAAAHMRKIERAREQLPRMPDGLQDLAEQLLERGAAAVQAFVANVEHALRERATLESVSVQLAEGQLVRIVSGELKHLGALARVTEVRRIRCHVEPIGTGKKVYLLNSDVEVVDEATITPTMVSDDDGVDGFDGSEEAKSA